MTIAITTSATAPRACSLALTPSQKTSGGLCYRARCRCTRRAKAASGCRSAPTPPGTQVPSPLRFLFQFGCDFASPACSCLHLHLTAPHQRSDIRMPSLTTCSRLRVCFPRFSASLHHCNASASCFRSNPSLRSLRSSATASPVPVPSLPPLISHRILDQPRRVLHRRPPVPRRHVEMRAPVPSPAFTSSPSVKLRQLARTA